MRNILVPATPMKKVLIVSYYWPPSGGSGVQRWLKFVKYLPAMGIEPHILIPSGAFYPQIDEELFQDVPDNVHLLKVPIWEPYGWYQRVTGVEKKKAIQASSIQDGGNQGLAKRLALWVRSNLFIPDARKFWIRPAAKAMVRYVKEQGIETVISTGPPHTCHLIALRAKRRIPALKWLADFRDPWTNIDFYTDLSLAKWADRKHRKLEGQVLRTADKVVGIGYTMGEEFVEMGAHSVEVITNGFDLDDFPKQEVTIDEGIVITHVGVIGKTRNPETLWRALALLKEREPAKYKQFKVRLVGSVGQSVVGSMEEFGIGEILDHVTYVPHTEVFNYLKRSGLLLVVVNNAPNAKGIVTGKVFEYMASGRPILGLGPTDGDLAKILEPMASAKMVAHGDVEKLYAYLKDFEVPLTQVDDAALRYCKDLTQQLVEVIDRL
ncbi:MAG: glycosyltransferase family 4 protein [Bacteroidota bacterium]